MCREIELAIQETTQLKTNELKKSTTQPKQTNQDNQQLNSKQSSSNTHSSEYILLFYNILVSTYYS